MRSMGKSASVCCALLSACAFDTHPIESPRCELPEGSYWAAYDEGPGQRLQFTNEPPKDCEQAHTGNWVDGACHVTLRRTCPGLDVEYVLDMTDTESWRGSVVILSGDSTELRFVALSPVH